MRRPTLKRLMLGLVQQTAALLLLVAIAAVLFNSYLAVDTADGTKVYELSPLDAETQFEDSVIFHDLFQSSVSDIIQLMVIKGQMETNGSFDPHKHVDITEFASGKTGGADCPVTAVYELEDLIKWGKYGAEYTDRIMSMSDFVNYFGPIDLESNFRVDADGQLVFVAGGEQTEEQKEAVAQAIEAIPESQRTDRLEDLAFTYIVKGECTGYPGIQRRRWYADGIFPDAGEPLCHRRRREAADSLCGQLDRIYCAAEQSGDDDPDVVSQL